MGWSADFFGFGDEVFGGGGGAGAFPVDEAGLDGVAEHIAAGEDADGKAVAAAGGDGDGALVAEAAGAEVFGMVEVAGFAFGQAVIVVEHAAIDLDAHFLGAEVA